MRTDSLIPRLRRLLKRMRRPRRALVPGPLPRLEARWVPSASVSSPAVVLLSAATRDSRGVTIAYRLDAAAEEDSPLQFRVYRSADLVPDAGDRLVGTWTAEAADDNGLSPTAPGEHRLTISLPDGLSLDPRRPYVVVAAGEGDPLSAAAFRKYTIGIVTHGAMVHSSWKHGPPWMLQTAAILQQQGFDAVIPFNWASQSSTPGHAAAQGNRLAHQVLQAAARFPAGAPVDVQFIGHSEGAVVNTRAIVALEHQATPELQAGDLVDTLLDPHAANNGVPGQVSTAGPLGWIASIAVKSYQSRAYDPPVFIPPGVDQAQVFYQHSPASRYSQIYNLWGQVPVPNLSGSPIAYYNLTSAGAVHSGAHGVALWYRNFVAPTLGDQFPLIDELQLTGAVEGTAAPAMDPAALSALARRRIDAWGPVRRAAASQPTFAGTAAPGSKVRVHVGPAADPTAITIAGQATADAAGAWSLTTRPLRDGRYRAVAMSYAPALRTRPGLTIVPMAPLGRFTIGPAPRL